MAEAGVTMQSPSHESEGGAAGQAADQAKEKAQEVAGQGRTRAREEIDRRSTQAGEKISSSAGDLRTVSDELRKQGKETPAKVASGAAERVERVGGYLRDSDSDRILRDVEDFGRRQPLALLVGGLVAGFALSRFLKASSSQRYGTYSYERQGLPTARTGNGAPTPARLPA